MGESFTGSSPEVEKSSLAERSWEAAHRGSPPFEGDELAPEEFLQIRSGILIDRSNDLLNDEEAAQKLEELAVQNPSMQTVHNNFVNREVNSQ
jgi:hypothetical protein